MRSIGRYEIKQELGRGAMATVNLAIDPHLQSEVVNASCERAGHFRS